MSLFVCAVISELPWNLLHGGKLLCDSQNVFFTLLLGFLGMCVIEQQKSRPVIQAAALLGLGVLSVLIRSDYSIHGYTFIVLLYILREHEVLRMFSSFSLQNHWFALGAFVPISLYNGKRGFIKGNVLKYAFYLFYPVHMFILYLIKYKIIFIIIPIIKFSKADLSKQFASTISLLLINFFLVSDEVHDFGITTRSFFK